MSWPALALMWCSQILRLRKEIRRQVMAKSSVVVQGASKVCRVAEC